MVFAIDGQAVAAVVTNGCLHPPTDVALSTALIYAGIPQHPGGHVAYEASQFQGDEPWSKPLKESRARRSVRFNR